MRILLVALLGLLFLPAGTAAQRGRTYKIIPAESSLWVYVAKGGLFSALAHNHEIGVKAFSGSVTVPESGAADGVLTLDIEAKSLTVLDKQVSEDDRTKIFNSMHSAVLESAKHPRITFKSVSVSDVKAAGENAYSLTVNGDLSLHGVTKRIAVPLSATMTPQLLSATGKYTLKQTEFGIKPYSTAGGAVKVKDDVVVNFNIVAKA